MKGYPNEKICTEYDFNTSEVIWNAQQKREKRGIWFQQQWSDIEYKNDGWCDINKTPLRWASRWAKLEKNKGTSQWGQMKYSSEFSSCGEIKYYLTRWCDWEEFPYLNLQGRNWCLGALCCLPLHFHSHHQPSVCPTALINTCADWWKYSSTYRLTWSWGKSFIHFT